MRVSAELLGRDPEIAELEGVLAEARRGQQRVALICGEPGIGKTAVVEALAARAEQSDFAVAWGRCWEGSGTPPYWPWVQVARSCLDGSDAGLLGSSGHRATEPAAERSRLFDDVAQRMLNAAGAGLLIVLEDLHAADEGTLQFLRFFTRLNAAVPLLLVGTYRVAEVAQSAPHQLALSAVARQGPTIRLRGLDRAQVETLLERAGAAHDRARAEDVHRLTYGNPFLVYQAAQLLRHQPGAPLPVEAGSVVQARLDPLDADDRDLLVAAAVIGREFSFATLSRVLDRPPDDLLEPLARAEQLLLLDEVALGRWSFNHSLLRDALLGEITDEERRALHRRTGTVLANLDDADASLPEVAFHFAEGDDPAALELCALAGDEAMAAFAFEDASRWFARALEHVPAGQDRRRYDLLRALGGALLKAGDETAAKDAHHRAIRTARALGSVELAAEAAVAIAPISMSEPIVIGALDDALCELPDADSSLRARVLAAFASVLGGSSVDRPVLDGVSRQGKDMARRVGDEETLWNVLWQWHRNSFGETGMLDERLEVADELVSMAERHRDIERLLMALGARGNVLFDAGQMSAAQADAQACLDTATQNRRPRSKFAALLLLAGIALAEARLDEAEALADRALAASTHLADPHGEVDHYSCLINVRMHQGRFEDVERLARDALERWTVSGIQCLRHYPLVLALAELGRPDEAKALLDELVGDKAVELSFGMIVPDIGWVAAPRLCCPTSLGEVCCLLDDRARVEPLYERLLPSAALNVGGSPVFRGAVARYLGQMAAVLGRFDDAEGHFQLAHRLHDGMGAQMWSAYGRLDHGRMLLGRNDADDRQRAAELLAEARDRFAELGLDFWARRAADLLGRARPASTSASLHHGDGQWTFSFGGRDVRLRDSKGVGYLALLLREPGREFHALELVGTSGEFDAERARQSVSRAVKTAVDRLHDAHPVLGEHLRTAVRVGVYSAYVPDPRAPIRWEG